jgi:hypothetical protein
MMVVMMFSTGPKGDDVVHALGEIIPRMGIDGLENTQGTPCQASDHMRRVSLVSVEK